MDSLLEVGILSDQSLIGTGGDSAQRSGLVSIRAQCPGESAGNTVAPVHVHRAVDHIRNYEAVKAPLISCHANKQPLAGTGELHTYPVESGHGALGHVCRKGILEAAQLIFTASLLVKEGGSSGSVDLLMVESEMLHLRHQTLGVCALAQGIGHKTCEDRILGIILMVT